MNILDYVAENNLVLVPVLYVLGVIIKATPGIADWVIPYVLLIIGIVLSIPFDGFSANAVIQGILVTGVAVLGNQMIKQFVKRDSTDPIEKSSDASK